MTLRQLYHEVIEFISSLWSKITKFFDWLWNLIIDKPISELIAWMLLFLLALVILYLIFNFSKSLLDKLEHFSKRLYKVGSDDKVKKK